MVVIITAQMSISDPDALDITVKSASTPEGRALAPTWDMVMDSKNGRITWDGYREQYLALLRDRYRRNPEPFHAVVRRERVVLKCYCPAGANCHRHIAAAVLAKIAVHLDTGVTREPELTRQPTTTRQTPLFDLPAPPSKDHDQND